MSGSISNLGPLGFMPFNLGSFAGVSGIFTPTQFSQGVPGLGITPEVLSAQQDTIAAQQAANLAAVTNVGAFDFTQIANLFGSWGNNLASVNTTAANAFSKVASNSAKACGGFFSCLFG
jgi:hypothetical protein